MKIEGRLAHYREIGGMPEVLECYRLSGEKDYPLKVVADDTPGYDAFVVNRLDRPAVSTDGPAESRS